MQKVKSLLKRFLPAGVFTLVRDLPFVLANPGEFIKTEESLIPSLRLMYDGPRDYATFQQNGQEALQFYKDVIGLSRNARILDIGSGIGRKTLPLLKYMDDDALYVGVDIDSRGVDWCSRYISPQNPRFGFFKINVYNKFYNPGGSLQAKDYIFPFPDDSFDAVFLWSVFTHMYPGGISHYLGEISRLLRPGGQCAASFYLMTDKARQKIRAGEAKQPIVHELADCWTTNLVIPEDLIAVSDSWLRKQCISHQLELAEPILLGAWSGNTIDEKYANLNFQDIVVMTPKL